MANVNVTVDISKVKAIREQMDVIQAEMERGYMACALLRGLIETFPTPWDDRGYCRFCHGGYAGYDGREDYHDAACIYEEAKALLALLAGEEEE